jgi:hypothetical protein
MKPFDNLQEVWDYCTFCPLCQKDKREISVSVGPDRFWSFVSFEKVENILKIICTYSYKQNRYFVNYSFNCIDNTFLLEYSSANSSFQGGLLEKAKEAYFFFYVDGVCPNCECSAAATTDLELDLQDGIVTNLQLEREKFFLLQEQDKFHVTLAHSSNIMRVSKYFDSSYEEEDDEIELPLFNLDLTNQSKLVNKLKTLILFS